MKRWEKSSKFVVWRYDDLLFIIESKYYILAFLYFLKINFAKIRKEIIAQGGNKMIKRKLKKVFGIILSATLMLSMAISVPQKVKAEDRGGDITMFFGATEIGNRSWTKGEVTNTVYTNNIGSFIAAGENYPARGPVKIELNKPYMTRMAKTINYGDFGDPGPFAYYYFTLEKAANVTIYGRTSEDDNSQMSFEKMSSTDSSFEPSTISIGLVKNNNKTKVINANLSAGSYLIQLSWGSTYPPTSGSQYSYVRVDVEREINKDTDEEWYQLFPTWDRKNKKEMSTPYQIGKKMNCSTYVGDVDGYYAGSFAVHFDEKSELSLTEQTNVSDAYVSKRDGTVHVNKKPAVLEAGDYVLCVSVKSGKTEYSFNTAAVKVENPVVAGVDTGAISGFSVSKETVTIRNLSENSEFCIWSGDKDNAGYGKGNAKLVIQGNCYVKTLVIDCPVEVMCEPGAKLVVGDLVVKTTDGAGGKLTYTDGTTYNEATKTFEVSCTHTTQIIVGKKDATCTVTGYTGDTHCKACNVKLQSGSSIAALNHSYDEGVITTQPTTTTEGVKTFTCTRCGDTKTETVAKLPDNSDNNQNKAEKQITGFATRMYSVVLGRTPDEGGLDYWTNELKTGKMDGAALASGFIGSPEFTEKNLSDEDYLKVLYNTFFDREADEAGMAYWLGELQTGMPRTTVLAGFVNSKEFGGICEDSGIARGTMEPDGSSIYNEGVYKFVLRNYTKALDRKGEVDGVEYWSHLINTKQMTALDCAKSFFGSQEFINKNLSDEDYVETLYATYFGRESDAEGKAYWLSSMKSGMSRDVVLSQFAESKEFSTIMAEYGL